MGNQARLGVICLMGLAIAVARLVEVEFRPPLEPLAIERRALELTEPPLTLDGLAPPVVLNSSPAAIPPASAEWPLGSVYVVRSGDTLGKISQRVSGTWLNWELIRDANRVTIPDPKKLRAGMRLEIPTSLMAVRTPVRGGT